MTGAHHEPPDLNSSAARRRVRRDLCEHGRSSLEILDDARRRQIVRNVFSPVVLLIEALQLAAAAGPTEKAVLMQVIGSIHA